ncbi:hypothetical protein WISP_122652 [Willisornis vidua]|uniref:Uncharacterized protein n=1 Tax=Willisornis vidua TaxID=1566151 RepID=A0ABQ9CRW9_9PASS|nr:hypothetical protein WISP_122652 [Willisornis vidua]
MARLGGDTQVLGRAEERESAVRPCGSRTELNTGRREQNRSSSVGSIQTFACPAWGIQRERDTDKLEQVWEKAKRESGKQHGVFGKVRGDVLGFAFKHLTAGKENGACPGQPSPAQHHLGPVTVAREEAKSAHSSEEALSPFKIRIRL